MPRDTISILDGSTFLVSDLRGDVDASPEWAHGLFYRDARFLSRWTLTANGSALDVLDTDDRLTDKIERLELRDVPGRWGRTDASARELEEVA